MDSKYSSDTILKKKCNCFEGIWFRNVDVLATVLSSKVKAESL